MTNSNGQTVLSDEEVTDTINRISRFKVSELKDLARSMELRLTGRKQDIIDRIIQFFEQGKRFNDNVRLLTVRTLVLKEQMHDRLPSYQDLYNAIRSGAFACTNVSNQYSRNNTSVQANGHSNDSAAYKGHSLYFQESPFYRMRRLVHGSPQVAFPSNGRSVCEYNFVLTPEEDEYLKLKKSIFRFYLLCGAQGNSSPSSTQVLLQFPTPVEIQINGSVFKESVRGIKGKPGTAKPADITSYLNARPKSNKIQMVYTTSEEAYLLYLYIVETISCEEIIQQIAQKPHIHKNSSIAQIRNQNSADDDDDDLVVSTSSVTLRDPLSYTKMKYPTQSIYCSHTECFDGLTFLESQLQIPTWSCPNCHKPVKIEDLAISDYFLEILESVPDDVDHVMINQDGSWEISKPTSAPSNQSYSKNTPSRTEEAPEQDDTEHKRSSTIPETIEIVSLDSDSDEEMDTSTTSVSRPSESLNSSKYASSEAHVEVSGDKSSNFTSISNRSFVHNENLSTNAGTSKINETINNYGIAGEHPINNPDNQSPEGSSQGRSRSKSNQQQSCLKSSLSNSDSSTSMPSKNDKYSRLPVHRNTPSINNTETITDQQNYDNISLSQYSKSPSIQLRHQTSTPILNTLSPFSYFPGSNIAVGNGSNLNLDSSNVSTSTPNYDVADQRISNSDNGTDTGNTDDVANLNLVANGRPYSLFPGITNILQAQGRHESRALPRHQHHSTKTSIDVLHSPVVRNTSSLSNLTDNVGISVQPSAHKYSPNLQSHQSNHNNTAAQDRQIPIQNSSILKYPDVPSIRRNSSEVGLQRGGLATDKQRLQPIQDPILRSSPEVSPCPLQSDVHVQSPLINGKLQHREESEVLSSSSHDSVVNNGQISYNSINQYFVQKQTMMPSSEYQQEQHIQQVQRQQPCHDQSQQTVKLHSQSQILNHSNTSLYPEGFKEKLNSQNMQRIMQREQQNRHTQMKLSLQHNLMQQEQLKRQQKIPAILSQQKTQGNNTHDTSSYQTPSMITTEIHGQRQIPPISQLHQNNQNSGRVNPNINVDRTSAVNVPEDQRLNEMLSEPRQGSVLHATMTHSNGTDNSHINAMSKSSIADNSEIQYLPNHHQISLTVSTISGTPNVVNLQQKNGLPVHASVRSTPLTSQQSSPQPDSLILPTSTSSIAHASHQTSNKIASEKASNAASLSTHFPPPATISPSNPTNRTHIQSINTIAHPTPSSTDFHTSSVSQVHSKLHTHKSDEVGSASSSSTPQTTNTGVSTPSNHSSGNINSNIPRYSNSAFDLLRPSRQMPEDSTVPAHKKQKIVGLLGIALSDEAIKVNVPSNNIYAECNTSKVPVSPLNGRINNMSLETTIDKNHTISRTNNNESELIQSLSSPSTLSKDNRVISTVSRFESGKQKSDHAGLNESSTSSKDLIADGALPAN